MRARVGVERLGTCVRVRVEGLCTWVHIMHMGAHERVHMCQGVHIC
jgi:hypothetical protein